MPQKALTRPIGNQGFVGVSGTAPRTGTISISAIVPRLSLYLKAGTQNDVKVTPLTALPFVMTFRTGDDFEAMATDDMTVTYTLTLDP